jgi:hypothetical protein
MRRLHLWISLAAQPAQAAQPGKASLFRQAAGAGCGLKTVNGKLQSSPSLALTYWE